MGGKAQKNFQGKTFLSMRGQMPSPLSLTIPPSPNIPQIAGWTREPMAVIHKYVQQRCRKNEFIIKTPKTGKKR